MSSTESTVIDNRTSGQVSASNDRKRGVPSKLAGVLLLVLFGGLALTSSQYNSPTVDEPLHLFAGYTHLRWGDFRANPEHPPLAKMLAAFPLALSFDHYQVSPSWDSIPEAPPSAPFTARAAAEMLYRNHDVERVFFPSRLMMIGIAVVLGCFVFVWSNSLFGITGALSALLIYALDPNVLAHASIIHSDLPFAAFFFIGTYFLWRSLNEARFHYAILTAVFFALAVVTKYAYVSIMLAWICLAIYTVCACRPISSTFGKRQAFVTRWEKAAWSAAVLGCAIAVAYLVVWAIYGFHYHAIPGGARPLSFDHVWPDSPALQALTRFLSEYRLVPEAWLYGQLSVFENLNRDSYLLGKTYTAEGSYLYFPVAIGVKTPIPTLVLLTLALLFLLVRNRFASLFGVVAAPPPPPGRFCGAGIARPDSGWLWLIAPVFIYLAIAVLSRMNIGLRHLLPIYPFLFVLCGGIAAGLWRSRGRAQRAVLLVLGFWYVASAMATFPNYLSYFNEFAGGPGRGHKLLLDSNLDWGQDLKRLRDWIDRAGVKKIQFAYFGFPSAAAPRHYGIDAQFLPGSWVHSSDIAPAGGARPDVLAISANQLHGLYFEGGDKDFVASLREVEPVGRAGYSIWLYRMDGAIEQLRRRVESSGSARDHYHLANLLSHQGRVGEAIDHYRTAVRIDPGLAVARKKLALGLAKSGELEAALGHLRAISDEPGPVAGEVQYYIGTILLYQRRNSEAVEVLRAASEKVPKSIQVHQQLAKALSAQGRPGEAVAHYRQALRLNWANVEAHVALSRLLAAEGRRDEAIRHYETALKLLKGETGGPNPSTAVPAAEIGAGR